MTSMVPHVADTYEMLNQATIFLIFVFARSPIAFESAHGLLSSSLSRRLKTHRSSKLVIYNNNNINDLLDADSCSGTTLPTPNESFNKRRALFIAAASTIFWVNRAASATTDERSPTEPIIVSMCQKPANGSPPNCVSTASVRQVDLYAAPWTWYDDSLSSEAIIARLKGAISYDPTLSIVQQTSEGLIVQAKRNFSVDQIIFRVNPKDRAVTFQSRQVEGPDVSDFGANRKRLEQLRERIQVLEVMGSEFASADSSRREGAADQLRAFWGYQSGGGYESVLLDEDDD